ncbi:MAG: hypothetical protein LBR11_13245, partial [Deltaproteobacteria bacterium]|nr:hypothetical protein [Deltaproteobacteria bacterium]
MTKNFLKLFKYIVIFVATCFFILISSYNYTYTDFIPEYSNEKFIRKRVGFLSIEMPESISTFHTLGFINILYKDYSLDLLENFDNAKDNDYRKYGKYMLNYPDYYNIAIENHELFDFIGNNSILFIREDLKESVYALQISFNGGRICLISVIKEQLNKDDKILLFKNRIANFLKCYIWVGNADIQDKGFKTKYG